MKANTKWLKQYVDCSKKSKDELEEIFTLTGTKVETVSKVFNISNVVIGRIEKITKHENADNLRVCDICIGSKNVCIITSATNVSEGDIVPVALDGANLAGGVRISKTDFRGVESSGMLCSVSELGLYEGFLGQTSDGILILPEEYSNDIGKDFLEVFDLDDDIYDFEITPNRQDCQGVMGIARELSVGLGRDFHSNLDYVYDDFNIVDDIAGQKVRVETDKCNRYILLRADDVQIEGMKDTDEDILYNLKAFGMNPKSNIVDITNYVLLELGQPVHAFDLDKIEGDIVVREAEDGEMLELLDDEVVTLEKGDVVIADEKKILALAGIMGGKYSAIGRDTKNVVFEIANFERKPLRDTARRLQITSDSLLRFEKKLPLTFPEYALSRIYGLFKKYNIGNVSNNIIDIQNAEIIENSWVELDDKKICSRLGITIPKDFMIDTLKKLEFSFKEEGGKTYVKAPKYRTDVERVEDLMEEIIRFYGYNNLNTTLPNIYIRNKQEDTISSIVDEARCILVDLGYSETIHYGFVSKQDISKLEQDGYIQDTIDVLNKLSTDYEVMQTTMVPSMLNTVALNENRKNYDLRFFEIGKVYLEKENIQKGILPREDKILVMCYTSKQSNISKKSGSQMDYIYNPIYMFKSDIQKLLRKIHLDNYDIIQEKENTIYHLGQCARIEKDGNTLGIFGMISPKISNNFEVEEDVYMLELNISKAAEYVTKKNGLNNISRFPAIKRDISIVVADDIIYDDIRKNICVSDIIQDVELFDIYVSDDIAGKSISISITFRDNNRTLKEEEVDGVMEDIISNLKDNLNAELRK